MDRPRFYRGLRITVSAVCGILCVLLILLWVRSYWHHDAFWFTGANNVAIGGASMSGGIVIEWLQLSPGTSQPGWHYKDYARPGLLPKWMMWKTHPAYWLVSVPDWLLVLAACAAAIAPWMSWRFSLRTLLIATTVIAAVLGLVVWSMS